MNSARDTSPGTHRKLEAIMFTDMVGYSALMQRDESLAIGLLEEHREILRSVFPSHDGREIETIGDAFLVEFESAINAARCALAIQHAIRKRNLDRPPAEGIMVRIGIHLGDVVRRGDRVYGDGVNVASRIQEQAGPGEVLVSEDIARQIRNAPDIPLTPVGMRTLKNIASPVELYRIGNGPPPAAKATAAGKARGPHRAKRWILAGLVLAAAAAAVIMMFVVPERTASVTRNSVAVLPFRNLGPDTGDAYFAEGMTDEVIRQVSRIGGIRVINSKSVSHFRSGDPGAGEVARILDVETILEGNVQRSAGRVKITVSLTEPFTGEQLWGDGYNRVFTDIFGIQEEIARGVAGGLSRKFFGDGAAGPRGVRQSYAEAYDLYLQGRFRWNRRTPAEVREAARLFGMAAEKDSTFALAWVGLADCYSFYGSPEYGVAPPGETYPKAEAAITRALGLDESLAEAHASLASIYFNYHWDPQPAERHFKRAIELNPNYATGFAWYADFLTALGRFEEARENIGSAASRDPLNLSVRMSSGVIWYFNGRFDSALSDFGKIRRLDSTFVPVYLWLGLTLAQLDRFAEGLDAFGKGIAMAGRSPIILAGEAYLSARMGDTRGARRIIGELKNLSREIYVSPYYLGEIYNALGEKAEAFRWFERAVREKSGAVVYMKVSPTLSDLRQSPEFHELLESAGLE